MYVIRRSANLTKFQILKYKYLFSFFENEKSNLLLVQQKIVEQSNSNFFSVLNWFWGTESKQKQIYKFSYFKIRYFVKLANYQKWYQEHNISNDSVCCFDVQMTDEEFWPFYTEKLSDFDPTLVILLLLVTIYICIKSAQKSDWILAEKVTFLFDFLSNTPVGVFLNFRSEFLELKKSDWILPGKVDGLFFCCCYWSGFCLTFCQLALLVVVKENNNCSSVTEKVSR